VSVRRFVAITSPGKGDERDSGERGDERGERDAAAALRQEDRREQREEDRCRVDDEHREGDRGELDRLEEQPPVRREQAADDEQAPRRGRAAEDAGAPQQRRAGRRRRRREGEPQEDEHRRVELDPGDDDGHRPPGGGDPGDRKVPAHRSNARRFRRRAAGDATAVRLLHVSLAVRLVTRRGRQAPTVRRTSSDVVVGARR
jgi:hypothetical protein